MSDVKHYIVFLAILGDPDVPVGVIGTGGYNKTVSELLSSMANSKRNIIVITNKNQFNSAAITKLEENIIIYRIDFNKKWQSDQNLIVDNIDAIIGNVEKVIKNILITSKIDLIHSFYWVSGIVATKIKDRLKIPFVHTVISLSEDKLEVGVKPHADLQRSIEADFLPAAEIIFAITPQEMYTLNNKYNIPLEKIKVVGRNPDRSFVEMVTQKKKFESYDDIPTDLNIYNDDWWISGAFLYVGRIVEIKGVHEIINAWIKAKQKYSISIPLWIVGGTLSQIDNMRRMIMRKNPSLVEYEKTRQIIWWGNLNSEGISTLMRKAQALVMHSCFEAGGRVIIEAFSAGIPVISTPYGFGKDYIYDNYNGFVVQFGDIDELSRVMMRFSEQPYLSSVMGEAACQFMNCIKKSWNNIEYHSYVYDSFIMNNMPINISNYIAVPKDLNSYKRRHCVTAFPYFSTERNCNTLSKMLIQKIGNNSVTIIEADNFHSDMYIVTANSNNYYLKCFYHVITDRLTKVQYKNTYVVSAYEQTMKSIDSSQFFNITDVLDGDKEKLFYIIPEYEIVPNTDSLYVLTSFWNELLPNQDLINLYSAKRFKELDEMVDSTNNSAINGLFCAEIAYKNLFGRHNHLPLLVEKKVQDIMNNGSQAAFGLNYGKGIMNHMAIVDGKVKLLPTHGYFLGELGYDIIMTFLQHNKDDVLFWNELKGRQKTVSHDRLDMWFLMLVYALEQYDKYKKTIDNILK